METLALPLRGWENEVTHILAVTVIHQKSVKDSDPAVSEIEAFRNLQNGSANSAGGMLAPKTPVAQPSGAPAGFYRRKAKAEGPALSPAGCRYPSRPRKHAPVMHSLD